jgi:hypothetical protein
MVDLGWPWWVTTLIAASVAILAGWIFIRTGQTALRALVGLVLLEAVAIAVVAPFVMDSDDSTGPAMSSRGLSSAEFAEKADANCRAFGKFAATLGNPKTHAGIERLVDRMMPEFWQSYVAQQDLEPPTEESAKAQEWMHAMAAFGRDQELIRAAAARRDAKGLQTANAKASGHAAQSARLSKELGMTDCFQ